MASLGYYLLLAAFVVCAYAAAMSVAGARRRSRRLIESGVGASYLMTAIMAVASSVMAGPVPPIEPLGPRCRSRRTVTKLLLDAASRSHASRPTKIGPAVRASSCSAISSGSATSAARLMPSGARSR